MTDLHFGGLLLVVTVAFAAPFLRGRAPRLRLASVVVEIVAGILIGPSVLGWVHIDEPIAVLSLIGLAFLLFLAGLEIEFEHLGGRALKLAFGGWIVSFAVAVVAGLVLKAAGLVDTPLLLAIILAATSLGIITPVLKDAGQISTPFGQLVVAAGTIADFGGIILLSLFFSGEGGVGSTVVLLAGLFGIGAAVLFAVKGAERSRAVMRNPPRLQDTTAPIRVRGASALMIGFVALAAVLQSTSLPFIVAATAIGQQLGLLDGAQSAALIAAGLLSVLICPVTGLALLGAERRPAVAAVPSEAM